MDHVMPGLVSAPNAHPVFVHFPIALWWAALLFWVLGAARNRADLFSAGRWLLYLGVLAALAAAATGWSAMEQFGEDMSGHDLIHNHMYFMFAAAGLAIITSAAAWWVARRPDTSARRWGLVGLLVATLVVTTLGADRGGLLVFRYGMGSWCEQPQPAEGHHHDHATEADHGGEHAGGGHGEHR